MDSGVMMERGAAAAGSSSTVAFSWEHEPGVSKKDTGRPVEASNAGPATGAKKAAGDEKPHHRLRVPPPPGGTGAPAVSPQAARSRRVRPEEDPFLAAYRSCTADGRREGGSGRKAAHKLLGWAGLALGLSCKSTCGVLEGRVVRLAKIPEVGADDHYYKY